MQGVHPIQISTESGKEAVLLVHFSRINYLVICDLIILAFHYLFCKHLKTILFNYGFALSGQQCLCWVCLELHYIKYVITNTIVSIVFTLNKWKLASGLTALTSEPWIQCKCHCISTDIIELKGNINYLINSLMNKLKAKQLILFWSWKESRLPDCIRSLNPALFSLVGISVVERNITRTWSDSDFTSNCGRELPQNLPNIINC